MSCKKYIYFFGRVFRANRHPHFPIILYECKSMQGCCRDAGNSWDGCNETSLLLPPPHLIILLSCSITCSCLKAFSMLVFNHVGRNLFFLGQKTSQHCSCVSLIISRTKKNWKKSYNVFDGLKFLVRFITLILQAQSSLIHLMELTAKFSTSDGVNLSRLPLQFLTCTCMLEILHSFRTITNKPNSWEILNPRTVTVGQHLGYLFI